MQHKTDVPYTEITEVLTTKGWKFIKDLVPGDELLAASDRRTTAKVLKSTSVCENRRS